MRISSITKNAGKACNNRLYRHIRTFEKIVKNYFVISGKIDINYDRTDDIALNARKMGYKAVLFFNIKENGLSYNSSSLCVLEENCIEIIQSYRI